MKTTIEISDPLLNEAKKVAATEGTTLRSLVEQGLRRVIDDRKRNPPAFRLRLVTSGGKGLNPDLAGKSWDEIRELAYRRGED